MFSEAPVCVSITECVKFQHAIIMVETKADVDGCIDEMIYCQ